jgi:hypothetical protein
MMWFHHVTHKEPSSVVSAVQSYLDGCYASYVVSHGQLVPSWAWLNRCAHGDLATVRSIPEAEPPSLGRVATCSWTWAEYILAKDLLAVVEDDEELLSRIQRQVLIPLEMALIERSKSEVLTAASLVFSVRAAIRSCLT